MLHSWVQAASYTRNSSIYLPLSMVSFLSASGRHFGRLLGLIFQGMPHPIGQATCYVGSSTELLWNLEEGEAEPHDELQKDLPRAFLKFYMAGSWHATESSQPPITERATGQGWKHLFLFCFLPIRHIGGTRLWNGSGRSRD